MDLPGDVRIQSANIHRGDYQATIKIGIVELTTFTEQRVKSVVAALIEQAVKTAVMTQYPLIETLVENEIKNQATREMMKHIVKQKVEEIVTEQLKFMFGEIK